jgi:hypothetical protein
MTPLPPPIEKSPRTRRRIVRRKVAVRTADATTPTTSSGRPLTGEELAARFKNNQSDPYNDIIIANINAARVAEKQKALDEGLPWD